MSKRMILALLVLAGLILFSSCVGIGLTLFNSCMGKGKGSEIRGMFLHDDQKVDNRTEQIISALKNKDREALKSLFSQKALTEATEFDDEMEALFRFIQGDIESWENEVDQTATDINYGKKSHRIQFSLDIKTGKDTYSFYVIDYSEDTIDPDNEGVYMLELIKDYGKRPLESWQDRMRAGIYIH